MEHKLGRLITSLMLTCVLISMIYPLSDLQAATEEDAFAARLPAASRSAEVDPALVAEGLKQVIARFAARGQTVNEQGARALLKQPLDYLRDYHYETAIDPSLGAALLVLNFEGDAIAQRLQQTSAPAAETLQDPSLLRPTLLQWWALESGERRQIISDPTAPWTTPTTTPFAQALAAATQAHALTLQLPLMDPRDGRLVQPRDVFGFLLEPIQKASQRYPSDGLVIGTVKPTSDAQWDGHWMLVINGSSFWFEGKQPTLETLLDQAMAVISKKLSSSPKVASPVAGQSQWLAIKVTQVADYGAQQALETYLGSLSWITGVQLQQVTAQQLTYRLLTTVPATQLPQQFAQEGRLQLSTVAVPASQTTNDLFYRWTE
jgi:hypothetical protein